ncbi:MAG TPA: enoyl-CoA hydratase [Burkholderiales bacterium]
MSQSEVLYAVAGGVATVTLNRPDKLNAWTSQMEGEVKKAMEAAEADDAVRAIVLTGAGRGFCAGADMNLLQNIQTGARTATADWQRPHRMDVRADWQIRYGYFPSLSKPVIGAINGACAGLGFVVALFCDVRFASDAAMFTTAFSRRGLIAEHGCSWLLPRLVGHSRALDLLLSARRVSADEALRIGLVDRVVAADQLMTEALAYAGMLASEVSPRSMAVIKKQLYEVPFQTMAEATATANAEMRLSFRSEDFKEGVAHFVEKRKPKFTGK